MDPVLRAFFEKHQALDIPQLVQQESIFLLGNTEPRKSLNALLTENISSAPIYDPDQKAFVGNLDVLDFVKYELALLKHGKDAVVRTTAELVNSGDGQHVQPIPIDATLSTVVERLHVDHLYRCSVVSHENGEVDVSRVLSQSTVVRFLATKTAELAATSLSGTVKALSGQYVSVLKVDELCSMRQVFERMVDTHTYGVAIVDAARGWLLRANVSVSDFRYVLDQPGLLDLSFQEFAQRHPNVGRPIVTVSETESVLSVIKKFAESRLHRLYIVPEGQDGPDSIPLGVLTLADILRICAVQAGITGHSRGRLLAVMVNESPQARAALAKALRIKKPEDSLLAVIGLELFKPVYAPAALMTFRKENQGLEQHAARALSDLLSDVPVDKKQHLEGVVLASQGPIKDRVIQFLHERAIDLVIAGSRNLGAAKGALLGSFSTNLLNHAPCNVLIVKETRK